MDGSRVSCNVLRSMRLDWEVVVVSVAISVTQTVSVFHTVSSIQTQRTDRLHNVGLNHSWGVFGTVVSSIQTVVVDRVRKSGRVRVGQSIIQHGGVSSSKPGIVTQTIIRVQTQ
uniref:Uncharacterized protein n=1 Tax=Anopheles funestus TaxID=62324 RepID=A0A182S4I7_ANOFN